MEVTFFHRDRYFLSLEMVSALLTVDESFVPL